MGRSARGWVCSLGLLLLGVGCSAVQIGSLPGDENAPGVCGSANGVPTDTLPDAGLCSAGSASTVSGAGPWSWTCAGTGSGAPASCAAPVSATNAQAGVCGAANGDARTSAPSTGLCSTGTPSQVSGNGPWTWSCQGLNGGGDVSCAAPVSTAQAVNGTCGAANGSARTSAPSTGLCSAGTPSQVSGGGPWTWSCLGINGGQDVSCTAPVSATQAVNGTCGAANGTARTSAPSTDLCSAGTPSQVSGSGPWTWSCLGINGGGDAPCSATVSSGSNPAGNPDGSCTHLSLPAEAQPVDTSHPTTVVGTGTAASCTFAALNTAVSNGGIITFNCGDAPVTIPITSPLTPPTSNAYANEPSLQIVIDGGNKVTLDGGKADRVLLWNHDGSWLKNEDTLTLQHLRIINGKSKPIEAIPACPASGSIDNTACSQGFNDGEGGALYMRDGKLRVIDCTFENNEAAPLGPDTGGGAIYVTATAEPVYIVQSSFLGNKASNAGAVGMLWAGGFILNSLFDGNSAIGNGANNNDPSQCTCINNGQNEIGSGGNGGALYKDGGDGFDVTVCGTQIRNNSANEFGAAVFFTADGSDAKVVIVDSLMKNNTSPISYWNWCVGVSTDTSTSSPQPVNSSFCTASGICSSTCSG